MGAETLGGRFVFQSHQGYGGLKLDDHYGPFQPRPFYDSMSQRRSTAHMGILLIPEEKKKKGSKGHKISLTQREEKRRVWSELLSRTRRVHVQSSPEQPPGLLPSRQEAEPPSGKASGWHSASGAAVPMACRQPWPMAVGREKTSCELQKESVMLHWRLQKHICIDDLILNH